MEISPTFIDRFNKAAQLAREGKHKEALAAYEEILASFKDQQEARVMTGEFLGTVELRKAYCLMDLGRYKEAKRIFESGTMQATLGQFNMETLFDYYFSYGNTLGNLGLIEKMDEAMSKAVSIAADELGDQKRCENTWYWIMYWGKEQQDWEYLKRMCQEAHRFGVTNEDYYLQHIAGEFGCYAYRGLGDFKEARRGAEIIIKRLGEAGASADRIKEWQDFLETLARDR